MWVLIKMPPLSYEERFTEEEDGIIKTLGIDNVMNMAQDTMAELGMPTVTPEPSVTPEPTESEISETDLPNIFTQWDIFGGSDKENFANIEHFGGWDDVLKQDWWSKPLLKVGENELVAFSRAYWWMSQVVRIITVILMFYFVNLVLLNNAIPTESAPNGRYVAYPIMPFGIDELLFGDEPKDADNEWSYKYAMSSHDNPELKEKYNVYFRQRTTNKKLKQMKTEQGETVPAVLGMLGLIASVGAPIKNSDKGTPEYVELLRRGAPMIPDPYLRIALVLPTVIFLSIWWYAADWITLKFDSILKDTASVMGGGELTNKDIKNLGTKKLKQLKELTGGGIRGREAIYLLYTSFFVLIGLGLLWVILGAIWYYRLVTPLFHAKNTAEKSSNTDELYKHNKKLFAENVLANTKDAYERSKNITLYEGHEKAFRDYVTAIAKSEKPETGGDLPSMISSFKKALSREISAEFKIVPTAGTVSVRRSYIAGFLAKFAPIDDGGGTSPEVKYDANITEIEAEIGTHV